MRSMVEGAAGVDHFNGEPHEQSFPHHRASRGPPPPLRRGGYYRAAQSIPRRKISFIWGTLNSAATWPSEL
jgi:hypothetical protein